MSEAVNAMARMIWAMQSGPGAWQTPEEARGVARAAWLLALQRMDQVRSEQDIKDAYYLLCAAHHEISDEERP